jgi:hypothetical protein
MKHEKHHHHSSNQFSVMHQADGLSATVGQTVVRTLNATTVMTHYHYLLEEKFRVK